MAKYKYDWLPKPKKLKYKYGMQWNSDGDCTLIPLVRQQNDRSVRGAVTNTCCDCGLTHIYLFEVFRGPNGDFFLNKRAHRVFKRKGRGIIES